MERRHILRGYKIEQASKGFQFVFYPGNVPGQAIGKSVFYPSRDECLKALTNFSVLVKEAGRYVEGSKNFKIIRQESKGGPRYIFEYYLNGKLIFYRHIAYNGNTAKQNCIKGINSIYRFISDYVDCEIID